MRSRTGDILAVLLAADGVVVRWDDLIQAVYPYKSEWSKRSIQTLIWAERKRRPGLPVETVRGEGLRWAT